jgi:RHS repeat-associated protein
MVETHTASGYAQHVYDPAGRNLALMLGQTFSGAWIPLPGGGYRLYQVNGTITGFRHPDWLGSARLLTSDTQTLLNDVALSPYGEDYAQSGSTPDLQFTVGSVGELTIAASGGQGLFDFDFRKYSPAQGRWISPDPAGLAAVSPLDPQSWNRYAYVGNRPLNSVDPLGLVIYPEGPPCDPFEDGCGGGGGGCDPSDAS